MRIAITGSKGLVGTALKQHLSNLGHTIDSYSKSSLDVTDFDQCYETIVRSPNPPDLVIHCAAYTNVDQAESDEYQCTLANDYATENIALCCLARDIPMVFFSTDAIFDGLNKGAYSEEDLPKPRSVYGASKWRSEQAITSRLEKYYIIRTTWVYGRTRSNFITQALDTFSRFPYIYNFSLIDQTATPTNVEDLARMVGRLIKTEAWGVYNYTNSGSASRKEVIKYMAAYYNEEITISDYTNCKAYRSPYCVFDLSKIESLLGPIPHWKDSLKEYIIASYF